MKAPVPAVDRPIVGKDGKLTTYGYDLLKRVEQMLADHEARLVAGGH